MNREYPDRPKMAAWAQYLFMTFGIANIAGVIISLHFSQFDLFRLLGEFLVGSAWFSFGLYGGLPLVSTVSEWELATEPDTNMHRRGLLVMRRRRWMIYASIPCALAIAVALIPVLIQAGEPGLIVLILGIPLAIINLRYFLSRCPRCGYGFFTTSMSRAAIIKQRKTCGHCGLSLYAYKDYKA